MRNFNCLLRLADTIRTSSKFVSETELIMYDQLCTLIENYCRLHSVQIRKALKELENENFDGLHSGIRE